MSRQPSRGTTGSEDTEYTGGRCICDDCCRQQPERLQERADLRQRIFRRWTPEMSARQKAQKMARKERDSR